MASFQKNGLKELFPLFTRIREIKLVLAITGGITKLSCFGKLFTAVLNNRLNKYLENMNVLCEKHAEFRKQSSTTDYIFNLKCLILIFICSEARYYIYFY